MVDSYVQLYRSSVLCDLLSETLEDLFEEGKVSQDLAVKVLDGFDKSCLEALTKRAEAKGALSVCSYSVAQCVLSTIMNPCSQEFLRNRSSTFIATIGAATLVGIVTSAAFQVYQVVHLRLFWFTCLSISQCDAHGPWCT